MNDRELLELAAKAVGEAVTWHETGSYFYRKSCEWPAEKGFFNPLHDDGEALRLATALDIDIYHQPTRAIAGRVMRMTEYFGGNKQRAVRRAIVRAAAEIGRAMP